MDMEGMQTQSPRRLARASQYVGTDITAAVLVRRAGGDALTLITHGHHLLCA
jgi:hypothetical protein